MGSAAWCSSSRWPPPLGAGSAARCSVGSADPVGGGTTTSRGSSSHRRRERRRRRAAGTGSRSRGSRSSRSRSQGGGRRSSRAPSPAASASTNRIGSRRGGNVGPEEEAIRSQQGQWPHPQSFLFAALGTILGMFSISRFALLTIDFGAVFIVQVVSSFLSSAKK